MCLDSTGCLINIFNIFLDIDNHKQVIVKKAYKLLFGCLELHFLFLEKQHQYLSENKLATNVPKFGLNIRAMSNALSVRPATVWIT